MALIRERMRAHTLGVPSRGVSKHARLHEIRVVNEREIISASSSRTSRGLHDTPSVDLFRAVSIIDI